MKIFLDGKFVDEADAKVSVFDHGLLYGDGVFEGIRAYDAEGGTAVFRLQDHLERLERSAGQYFMEIPFSVEDMRQAVHGVISSNSLGACYIRPIVYRGYGDVGVNPLNNPIDVAIAVWEWGAYLGPDALEKGVAVKISSWTRSAPNTFPAMAKSVANYANSGLIKMEAVADGYSEGIALDTTGQLSEGSGQNLFLVRDHTLYTPPVAASILPGITRDTIMTLAKDLGLGVKEQALPREMTYVADEMFFVGTAVEVTPITSVDRIQIGNGKCGPVTRAIQKAYFDYVNGKTPDRHGWLTYVNASVGAR